jgi:hypothetical protein
MQFEAVAARIAVLACPPPAIDDDLDLGALSVGLDIRGLAPDVARIAVELACRRAEISDRLEAILPPPPAPPKPLWTDAEAWAEADIPKRQWVAPGYALRGAVTVLAGAGGVSKSSLAAAWGAALALGRAMGEFKPAAPGKALIFNVEDDSTEQRRRLSAILRQFDATPVDLGGRLVRVGPFQTGMLFEREQSSGHVSPTAAYDQLIELIEAERPDLVILDPLVELHGVDENDNTAVRSIIAQLRALAVTYNMGVLLVHHSKKGTAQSAGEVDSLRGASAIAGAARIVLTVTQMTGQEAENFGKRAKDGRHYFRVDGAKANYSALTECEWFERVQIPLDNSETIAAPVPWTPPQSAAGEDTIAAILADIAAGSPDGPWSPQLASSLRSVRGLFLRHGISGATAQGKMLTALTSERGVMVCTFMGKDRKPAKGLRVGGLPASAKWIEDDV